MRFGILAHSSEGAALCYLTFCREGFREMRRHMHPDVMLDCTPMGRAMPAWEAGDLAAVRAIMAQSVERLADGGCDFFACPDNTAHIALESEGSALALPGLNIADVVAEQASALGMKRVAVLGKAIAASKHIYSAARCWSRGSRGRAPCIAGRFQLSESRRCFPVTRNARTSTGSSSTSWSRACSPILPADDTSRSSSV